MVELICKIAGSLFVLTAAAAFGEAKARDLAHRVRQLQQFQRSLKLLNTEITFSRALLPHAFQAVSRRLEPPVSELYSLAASALLSGDERSAREIWDSALAEIPVSYTHLDVYKRQGKEGQNARLAAKLTGWKIDIKSESQLTANSEEDLQQEE